MVLSPQDTQALSKLTLLPEERMGPALKYI